MKLLMTTLFLKMKILEPNWVPIFQVPCRGGRLPRAQEDIITSVSKWCSGHQSNSRSIALYKTWEYQCIFNLSTEGLIGHWIGQLDQLTLHANSDKNLKSFALKKWKQPSVVGKRFLVTAQTGSPGPGLLRCNPSCYIGVNHQVGVLRFPLPNLNNKKNLINPVLWMNLWKNMPNFHSMNNI